MTPCWPRAAPSPPVSRGRGWDQALGVTGQAVGQRLRARRPDVDLSRPAGPAPVVVSGWAVPVRPVDEPVPPAPAGAAEATAATAGGDGVAQLELQLTGGPTVETPPARTPSRRDRRRRRRR
jgi:hypothetical protein